MVLRIIGVLMNQNSETSEKTEKNQIHELKNEIEYIKNQQKEIIDLLKKSQSQVQN